MGVLGCDICGGNIIIESGGRAICKACGMEYTIDRVKEKVKANNGIIQLDSSNMVITWMKMASDAAVAGNHREAYDYYTKVLEVEPTNWRAIFGKGKAAAWQSTLGNSRTPELYQAIISALKILENSDISDSEIASIKNLFAVSLYDVNNAFLSLRREMFEKYDDKYYDLHADEWWNLHYIQATANVKQTEYAMSLISDLKDETSASNYMEMKKHICEVLQFICSNQDTYWNSYSKEYLRCFGLSESSKKIYVEKYIELVMEIRESEPDFRKDYIFQIDPWDPPLRWEPKRYEKLMEYWTNREQEVIRIYENLKKKKRIEEYWTEHEEEKQRLDNEYESLKNDMVELQSRKEAYEKEIDGFRKMRERETTSEKKKNTTEKQILSLMKKQSELGLFKVREKKELQFQIDDLESNIHSIDEAIRTEKEEQIKMYNEKIREVKRLLETIISQITIIQARIDEITDEYTKDRY